MIIALVRARDLIDRKKTSILLVRAEVLKAARRWLNSEGFIEVQGPIILPAFDECSSFKVDFFGKPACLAGGLQPYSDFFSANLKKAFTIAPAFRNDRSKSNHHLAEYWRIETTVLGQGFEAMLSCQEQMVTYICKQLEKKVPEALSILSEDTEELKHVKPPFPRITYDQAMEKLQEKRHCISWGQDLDRNSQRELSLMFKQPFFITNFPISAETLTQKSPPNNPHLTLSADLFAPRGYGEISSGGESLNDKKDLLDRLMGADISATDCKWYLSLKRWTKIPQYGYALGIERFLSWVCNLKSAREASAFPRSSKERLI